MTNRPLIEKLIGMLGSDHAGEVFNAAQKLVKIANEEKKTLVELLIDKDKVEFVGYSFYEEDVQYNPFKNNMAHVEIRNRLKFIRLTRSVHLTIWERDFIDGIDMQLVRYGALTGKQLAAANSIFNKVKGK